MIVFSSTVVRGCLSNNWEPIKKNVIFDVYIYYLFLFFLFFLHLSEPKPSPNRPLDRA